MKKSFTYLFLLLGIYSIAQLPVSQVPEKKKVVLEEFTGKTCTFCPDGHRIANEIRDADPENVFLINVHTGSYASGTPNYRTAYGTALANQSGLSGYPAGTVNRHVFSGSSTALNRGQWSNAASTIKSQDAYVNVALEADIDVVTNELVVNVEAYYTANSPASTNYLNVAITQDEIWGPQTGASNFYPENVDPETGMYKHMHMLREMITGQWGEVINTTTAGTLIQKTYTYVLPSIIGDVPVDISKLHIVAFITETHQEIINGNGTTPTLSNLPNNLEAEVVSLKAPESSCDGIVQTVLKVRNFGQQDITSMDLSYSVNSGTSYTYNWSGAAILPGLSVDIDMPLIGFQVLPENILNVTIDKVNGTTDDVVSTNFAYDTISSVPEHQMDSMVIVITPDNYASEISWKLEDFNGAVVASGPSTPWTDGDTSPKTFTVSVEDYNCYTFTMLDSYGDGIASPGGVQVTASGSGAPVYSFTNESYSVLSYKFATLDANGNGDGNGDGSGVNPTSINTIDNSLMIEIYPNPSSSLVQVYALFNTMEKLVTMKVYSVDGRLIEQNSFENTKEINSSLDVSTYTSGLYFVELQTEKGQSINKLMVK